MSTAVGLALIFGLFFVFAVPASLVEAINEHRNNDQKPTPHPWRWAVIALMTPVAEYTLSPGFIAIYFFVTWLYASREISYAVVGWAYQHNKRFILQQVLIIAYYCMSMVWLVMQVVNEEA